MADLTYWISLLAWNILLLAAVTALSSRCKTKLWQRFWPLLTTVVQGIPIIGFVIFGGYLLKQNLQPAGFFWCGLILLIGYIIGVVVVFKNTAISPDSNRPIAAAWPRLRLWAAFGILLAVNLTCLEIIQLNAMNDLSAARTMATTELLNLMPPKVPDHLNARPVYEEAFRIFTSGKNLPEWFHDDPTSDFDPTHPRVAVFLEQQRDVLSKAKQAAGIPAYCPEINSMNYMEWPMVNFASYRNLARLLSLDALLQANSGDIKGAGETLEAIRKMSIHLDRAPFLISFVIANVIDEIRVRCLEYILSQAPELKEELATFPIKPRPTNLQRVSNALRLETLGQLQGFTIMAASNNMYLLSSKKGPEPRQPTGRTKMWRAFFMQSDLRAARDIIAGNLSRKVTTYSELEANLETISRAKESGQMGIFTSIGMSSYSAFVARAKYRDAYEGLADLALAAAAYKKMTGHYPEMADALLPQYIEHMPADPFDGQALKIDPTDCGIDIHTIDPELPALPGLGVKGAVHFHLEDCRQ